MAYSAHQTKLYCKVGGASTFTEVPHLMEVPEFGGTPEKIDVTTLSDTSKKYLPGMKDYGDLVFKFLYDNTDANSNYRILKTLDESNAVAAFKLEYPDGTAHQFDAVPSIKMGAGAVNGALTFIATMVLQSDVNVTNPEV